MKRNSFKYLLLLLLLLSATVHLSALSKSDSLINVLKKALQDTHFVSLLNELAREYQKTKPDTSFILLNQSKQLGQKLKYIKGYFRSEMIRAVICRNTGKPDTALAIYEDLLQKTKNEKDSLYKGEIQMMQGFIFQNKGDYEQSAQALISSIRILSSCKARLLEARALWMLGNTYYRLSSFDESVREFEKGQKIFGELADSTGYFDCITNAGLVYGEMGKLKESETRLLTALAYYRRIHHAGATSAALINLSNIYVKDKKAEKALVCANEALKLKEQLGAPLGIATCKSMLGSVYASLGDKKNSEKFFNEAIALARQENSLEVVMSSYQGLYSLYKKKGDDKKALLYHELFTDVKDSIFNAEKTKSVEEMKARFETEKKDKEILMQKNELVKSEADQKRQNTILITVSSGLVVILLFSFFIYGRMRIIRRQKDIITKQQKETERQRKLIDEAYHDLHEKNKEVLDSIKYAQRIQRALITSEKYIERSLRKFQKKGF